MSLRPEPEEARELLRRELARSEYNQQSPIDRFWDWLQSFWVRLTGEASQADHLSTLAVIVVVLVVLSVLALAASKVRRDRRVADRQEPGVLESGRRTADELRRSAEAAAAEQRHSDAVADAVRALARRTVERGLLEDSPGRTTHEVFALVAQQFPEHGPALGAVADLFDAVVYGSRTASAEESRGALLLEADVRRARSATPGTTAATSTLRVPR